MGPEKAGLYPKINADTNFSWMWTTAFAMAAAFFAVHFGAQQAGLIDPPIDYDHVKRKGDKVPAEPVETAASPPTDP